MGIFIILDIDYRVDDGEANAVLGVYTSPDKALAAFLNFLEGRDITWRPKLFEQALEHGPCGTDTELMGVFYDHKQHSLELHRKELEDEE